MYRSPVATMTDEQPSPPIASLTPQPLAARAWEVLLIVMVFFILAGQPTPHVNEPHYLCRLKHYWDPAWCQGDLFLDSPEAHLVFAWSFGWLTKWLSLPALAWTGRLFVWSLLAWAWQRLSWRITPVPLAAVLSAALWVTFTRYAHLAGEWVVGGVEAKCVAYGFVLVALREFIDNRWNRGWIALGAASAFRALVGGWSVLVCGGIWIGRQLEDVERRQQIVATGLAMLPGLLVGGVIALAGVLPALALTWNEPPEIVAEAHRIYVFERLPHHLALLSLPASEFGFRMASHTALIAGLFAAMWLHRRTVSSTIFGLRFVAWYAYGAMLLAVIGFAVELAFWNDPSRAASLLRFYWFRLTDVAVSLAAALYIAAIVAEALAARRSWAPWALAAALAIACFGIGDALRDQAQNPVPPSDRRMRNYTAWLDVCEWIAANTPPDAGFLTPRPGKAV